MITALISFAVITLVVTAMAVGVICGRAPIQGSCGGLNQTDGNGDCEVCGDKPGNCDRT